MSDDVKKIAEKLEKSKDHQQKSQSNNSLTMSSVAGVSSSNHHSDVDADDFIKRQETSKLSSKVINSNGKDDNTGQLLLSSMQTSHLSDDGEIEVLDCKFFPDTLWPSGNVFRIDDSADLNENNQNRPLQLQTSTSPTDSVPGTNTFVNREDNPQDGSGAPAIVVFSSAPVLSFDHQAIPVNNIKTDIMPRRKPMRNNDGDNPVGEQGHQAQQNHQNTTLETNETFNHSTASTAGPGQNKLSWEVQSHLQNDRDRLRFTLRYYFMSPFDKWNFRSRFPWKLVLQLLKILLVTAQTLNIGHNFSRFQQIDHPIVSCLFKFQQNDH